MFAFSFHRLFRYFIDAEPMVLLFWIGLVFFTIGLAILMYTRWGQYKPLRKCMGLSLLVHLMLACYATTIQITMPAPAIEPVIGVTIGDFPDDNSTPVSDPAVGNKQATAKASNERPWELFATRQPSQPGAVALERTSIGPVVALKRSVYASETRLPGESAVDHIGAMDSRPSEAKSKSNADETKHLAATNKTAAAIVAPPAERREAEMPAALNATATADRLASEPVPRAARTASDGLPDSLLASAALHNSSATDDPAYRTGGGSGSSSDAATAAMRATPSSHIAGNRAVGAGLASLSGAALANVARDSGSLPGAYRLRTTPNKTDVVQLHGGTPETEIAVRIALKWLADNQAADGRWNPRDHGGGNPGLVSGQDRQKAGSRADTAVTGLALLAFLASGHTHLDGIYREDVRRGLDYLIRVQTADGNLSGEAQTFEFMYSHAMAACALSEAYGMTRDSRLREPMSRAVNYTIRAQDPKGGGWRYRPGEAGDTSILGWQLMSLKSAELAGVPMPDSTKEGVMKYLRSVASGKHGGHASYRQPAAPTNSMTAEALVCWQFLGISRQHPACDEAGDLLLKDMPTANGESNFYYWYYGTLAMYQLQGDHWKQWNKALRENVVQRQIKTGPQAGSWEPNDVWGRSGGRIYTTALATLALEVYYRFLPLYVDAGPVAERKKQTTR